MLRGQGLKILAFQVDNAVDFLVVDEAEQYLDDGISVYFYPSLEVVQFDGLVSLYNVKCLLFFQLQDDFLPDSVVSCVSWKVHYL